MLAAMTDLAHHYRLPMFGTAGCTDAKSIDAQAGMEAALSCLVSELSGANLTGADLFIGAQLTDRSNCVTVQR